LFAKFSTCTVNEVVPGEAVIVDEVWDPLESPITGVSFATVKASAVLVLAL
jgi:hypothetical protein